MAVGQVNSGASSIAERLRGVVVARRAELDVSRHVFRDGPAYILRDPVSFSTTRLDPSDYRIYNAIHDGLPLGEIFAGLVAIGELEGDDEDRFYEFILDLHQRTLLTLPVNNADALYQRFERRRLAERRSKALGFLFLRVPLINPDRFLSATMPYAKWLFTKPALYAWGLLCLAALGVAISRWQDLAAPALNTLTGDNLALLWVTLIVLKGVHEFGHAYACKAFGGHVPEIGVFMILFTPVAYVDATDSWSFPSAKRRAIVTLGGMYFESIVGAIAVFVWAFTDPGALNAIAYKVLLLSTVVTAMFNMNPLMRYDAYYLASDLSGIPNLRARSQAVVAALAKRWILGLRPTEESTTRSPGLAAFGIAQLMYKSLLFVSIATILVLKFGPVGIAMASIFLFISVGKPIGKLVRYLIQAEELAPVRPRAIAVTGVIALATILGLGAIPLNAPVKVSGIVTHESTSAIRSPAHGTIHAIHAKVGDEFRADEPLLTLESAELQAQLDELHTQLWVAQAAARVALTETPGAFTDAETSVMQLADQITKLQQDMDALQIRAPALVRITAVVPERPGMLVEPGAELIRTGSGAIEAKFLLDAPERDSTILEVGQKIVCRVAAMPDRPIQGTITHIDATGSREAADEASDIPIDPVTGLATEPYFEVRVRLDLSNVPTGGAVHAQFPAQPRTIVQILRRRVSGFFNHARIASATN